mmetsp:Transcript_7038/g.13584  ORF Transcript_7038/g.13584 Transcript_7038/m.13584 type:complete len:245 (-) Transcript_7038:1003-1737(-)
MSLCESERVMRFRESKLWGPSPSSLPTPSPIKRFFFKCCAIVRESGPSLEASTGLLESFGCSVVANELLLKSRELADGPGEGGRMGGGRELGFSIFRGTCDELASPSTCLGLCSAGKSVLELSASVEHVPLAGPSSSKQESPSLGVDTPDDASGLPDGRRDACSARRTRYLYALQCLWFLSHSVTEQQQSLRQTGHDHVPVVHASLVSGSTSSPIDLLRQCSQKRRVQSVLPQASIPLARTFTC